MSGASNAGEAASTRACFDREYCYSLKEAGGWVLVGVKDEGVAREPPLKICEPNWSARGFGRVEKCEDRHAD